MSDLLKYSLGVTKLPFDELANTEPELKGHNIILRKGSLIELYDGFELMKDIPNDLFSKKNYDTNLEIVLLQASHNFINTPGNMASLKWSINEDIDSYIKPGDLVHIISNNVDILNDVNVFFSCNVSAQYIKELRNSAIWFDNITGTDINIHSLLLGPPTFVSTNKSNDSLYEIKLSSILINKYKKKQKEKILSIQRG